MFATVENLAIIGEVQVFTKLLLLFTNIISRISWEFVV